MILFKAYVSYKLNPTVDKALMKLKLEPSSRTRIWQIRCSCGVRQFRTHQPRHRWRCSEQRYLLEFAATPAHVSTISSHNSRSCSFPVASKDLKHAKAVPSKPVYTVASMLSPLRPCLQFHVPSTT